MPNSPPSVSQVPTLLEMFTDVVRRNPKGIAILTAFDQLSYEELEIEVSKYRLFIRQTFVREEPVAIFGKKSKHVYAWMLACLFEGIPYVNLDLKAPVGRNIEILKLLEWPNVFTDFDHKIEDNEYLMEIINLDIDGSFFIIDSALEIMKSANQNRGAIKPNRSSVSTDLLTIAYIMFTSGSTGVPKGVAINHLGLMNLILWARDKFSITSSTVLTGLNPLYFDNSVFDFYCSIFNGATLCSVSKDELYDLETLRARLIHARCNLWFSVPSLIIYLMRLSFFDQRVLSQFKKILFGGEAFPKPLLKEFISIFPKLDFYNIYGPTEGTCICSAHLVLPEDLEDLENKFVPIGKLNPGFDFILESLDEEGVGELILFGANISPGYIGLADENKLKFGVIDNLKGFGRRFYRTGDLFSFKEENLFFEGRKDNQVKIMGHRIELEEIDVAASKFNGLKNAVTFAIGEEDGSLSLGLLCELKSGCELADLELYLRQTLPSYMVPKHLRQVSELPTNQNGKIARNLARELFLTKRNT